MSKDSHRAIERLQYVPNWLEYFSVLRVAKTTTMGEPRRPRVRDEGGDEGVSDVDEGSARPQTTMEMERAANSAMKLIAESIGDGGKWPGVINTLCPEDNRHLIGVVLDDLIRSITLVPQTASGTLQDSAIMLWRRNH